MKNFLLSAISNRLGIWNGFAQICAPKGHFLGWGYDKKSPICNILGVRLNAKIADNVLNKNFTTYLSFQAAKNISEIRVADKSFEYCAGIIPRSTLSRSNQFNIHVNEENKTYEGTSFFFAFKFDKNLNFSGIHNVYIELKPLEEDSLFGHSIKGNYTFYINVDKALVDECNSRPEILIALQKKFQII